MTENLLKAIAPYRNEVVCHPLYQNISTVDHIKTFMSYHVFAVWDFMSLLKTLQRTLTCITIPWFPAPHPDISFLINEIVVGEESDEMPNGGYTSHFSLYLEAMKEAGAHENNIHTFLKELGSDGNFERAYQAASVPKAARDFMEYTFQVIQNGKIHEAASLFTFGREDLIPDMFISFIQQLAPDQQNHFRTFTYYLERHIEVDGGHHGALALRMVEKLCGDDKTKWKEATAVAIEALQHRKMLWDGVLEEINGQNM